MQIPQTKKSDVIDKIDGISIADPYRWLGACGGGCAYQRWLNGGFGAAFPQCGIRKALFEHVERRLQSLI